LDYPVSVTVGSHKFTLLTHSEMLVTIISELHRNVDRNIIWVLIKKIKFIHLVCLVSSFRFC